MARTPKADSQAPDGMSMLALMPFPAVNPWNWGALAAPANAMRAALYGMHATLDAWRIATDAARMLVREQQDTALRMLEGSLAADTPASQQDGAADAPGETAETAADFVTPMLEASRAYHRAGRAFIVAQRKSFHAFAPPDQRH